jgi:uncharacterized membrane protein YbhN (UPF0104 family)
MLPDPAEVVKQLGLYADAITGFAVAQSIAFVFLLGKDKRFASSVFKYHSTICLMLGLTVGFTILYSYLVDRCHKLRGGILTASPAPEPNEAGVRQGTLDALSQISSGQILLVCLAGAVSVVGIAWTWYTISK